MKRVIVICPEALLADAKHLACCLGTSLADFDSFSGLNYEDGSGNKYAISNALVSPTFSEKVGVAVVRPEFDTGEAIDMTKAAASQALVDFTLADVENSISARFCDTIEESLAFITEAGLSQIPLVIE